MGCSTSGILSFAGLASIVTMYLSIPACNLQVSLSILPGYRSLTILSSHMMQRKFVWGLWASLVCNVTFFEEQNFSLLVNHSSEVGQLIHQLLHVGRVSDNVTVLSR
jgi:hypothetical protein